MTPRASASSNSRVCAISKVGHSRSSWSWLPLLPSPPSAPASPPASPPESPSEFVRVDGDSMSLAFESGALTLPWWTWALIFAGALLALVLLACVPCCFCSRRGGSSRRLLRTGRPHEVEVVNASPDSIGSALNTKSSKSQRSCRTAGRPHAFSRMGTAPKPIVHEFFHGAPCDGARRDTSWYSSEQIHAAQV